MSVIPRTPDPWLMGLKIYTLHSYAVYVLEASTSNRLTYYFPPLVGADVFRGGGRTS